MVNIKINKHVEIEAPLTRDKHTIFHDRICREVKRLGGLDSHWANGLAYIFIVVEQHVCNYELMHQIEKIYKEVTSI